MDDFYSGGRKTTWRGWCWNRVAERVTPYDRKNAVVVCLAGPQNRDRCEAISRGFGDHNVIAVDISDRCVDSARLDGGLAIKGDLRQVLDEITARLPVTVVVADLMCGLNERVKELIRFRGGTWVLNLQRGRDQIDCVPSDNGIPLSTMVATSFDYWAECFDWSGVPPERRSAKHRGFLAICEMAIKWHDILGEQKHMYFADKRCESEMYFLRRLKPQLYSYRSERGVSLWFDTVVYSCLEQTIEPRFQQKQLDALTENGWYSPHSKDSLARRSIKNKCSALLAVRTKKKKKRGVIH